MHSRFSVGEIVWLLLKRETTLVDSKWKHRVVVHVTVDEFKAHSQDTRQC